MGVYSFNPPLRGSVYLFKRISLPGMAGLREQFRFIPECFEFDGIAAEIQEKHGFLFTCLAGISDLRFDKKPDSMRFQSVLNRFKYLHFQYTAKMGDGDFDAVYFTAIIRLGNVGTDVCGELISKEVKIDPVIG
jgi:hypothetical protein